MLPFFLPYELLLLEVGMEAEIEIDDGLCYDI